MKSKQPVDVDRPFNQRLLDDAFDLEEREEAFKSVEEVFTADYSQEVIEEV